MAYTATYESVVKGGSSEPGSNPRDEEVLALARTQLARPNLKLVKIEFDDELIWWKGHWMREQPENAGDGDE